MKNLWIYIKKLLKRVSEQPRKIPQKITKSETLDTTEIVERVIVDFEKDILYVDVLKGLNVRKTPEVRSNNIIEALKFGEEINVIEKKDRWFKVSYRNEKVGWIVSEYLTEESPKTSTSEMKRNLSKDPPIIFDIGRKNLATSENTKRVREFINHAFGHTEASGVSLQCVEYVHYKVKKEIDVDIVWPSDRPRHGGRWVHIFKKNNMYKILDEPIFNSAMSFTNPNFNKPYGHVAYVDEVFPDGSIMISEANWPHKGIYNERPLSKQQWSQEKWGAKFIDFKKKRAKSSP